ncbi:AAA-ATPase At3g50940 [Setaria viridis]|uniref:AAA-ATPase At3g50940 n=1 Tax=Setaria viridis TaxID=4556 RepID=UPI001493B527|nr:AAA-ATPase At3g50940-like [Setaria viridis]
MEMDPSAAEAAKALALPSYAKAVDAYRKAVGTAASVTAYVVLARGMARELLPHDLRRAARWAASLIRARFETPPAERRTLVIKSAAALLYDDGGYRGVGGGYLGLYDEVREYLATRIDPHAMRRLCLGGKTKRALSLEHGDSMTDVFEGVEFTWASVAGQSQREHGNEYDYRYGSVGTESLELSFDAEHMDMALGRYVPFITATVADARRRERALQIFINEGSSWHGIKHHHPSTFDTLAMDPELKRSIVADLDRFLKRKEYYQRIGKAWKRGYLLYGPPGTGKSSLVAAMANYLRFNLYDLDLSEVYNNTTLQRLLNSMPNKSILVIEDIDCCFSAASRKEKNDSDHIHYRSGRGNSEVSYVLSRIKKPRITLSGLLNFIDGLWSTSGEERIIIFTTNYKDRLDPALLRPGRMDMHVYMGYCCWEAFRTLARNYFVLDDHARFPEIQELLAEVEVTPAEVSEMLLRSEEVDVVLGVLAEFLGEKKRAMREGESVQAHEELTGKEAEEGNLFPLCK